MMQHMKIIVMTSKINYRKHICLVRFYLFWTFWVLALQWCFFFDNIITTMLVTTWARSELHFVRHTHNPQNCVCTTKRKIPIYLSRCVWPNLSFPEDAGEKPQRSERRPLRVTCGPSWDKTRWIGLEEVTYCESTKAAERTSGVQGGNSDLAGTSRVVNWIFSL
jgi:hypothetical protein